RVVEVRSKMSQRNEQEAAPCVLEDPGKKEAASSEEQQHHGHQVERDSHPKIHRDVPQGPIHSNDDTGAHWSPALFQVGLSVAPPANFLRSRDQKSHDHSPSCWQIGDWTAATHHVHQGQSGGKKQGWEQEDQQVPTRRHPPKKHPSKESLDRALFSCA